MAIDDRTANLNLPKPNADNTLLEDVARLREALDGIDTAVFERQTAAQVTASVNAAINAVLDDAPAALDTLGELAAALDDDENFAATVTTALAGLQTDIDTKLSSVPMASDTVLGGIKVGTGLAIDGSGVLSASGAGQTFTMVPLTISSNGQTAFTVSGGYTVGSIELLLNGVELVSGDDYTATNGTSVTLTVGAQTTDTLILRKWGTFSVADALKPADMASQAEAEAGSDVAEYMNPLRVKQSVEAPMRRLVGMRGAYVDLAAGSNIDLSLGNYFSKTITGTTTFTVSNVPASGTGITFSLELTNAGAYTVNLWAGVKKTGGTAVTFTASGRDRLFFTTRDGGTTWDMAVLKDMK